MKRQRIIWALALGAVLAWAAAPGFSQDKQVTGNWKCMAKIEGQEPRPFSLELTQKGAEVTGTASRRGNSTELRKGAYEGGKLTFQIEIEEGTVNFEATLADDKLSGSLSMANGMKANWEGTREQAATVAAGSDDVVGSWKVLAKQGDGTIEATMEIKREAGALGGKITLANGESQPLRNVTFEEKVLKVQILTDDGTYHIEGKLDGEKISGTYKTPSGRQETWEAKRL